MTRLALTTIGTACLSVALCLPSALAVSKEVTIPVSGLSLHGTLETPDGVTNPPVALIIAGSGPTDRNGNSPGGVLTSSYQKLADALAAQGIATLRYDKRGIAASALPNMDESRLSFTDYVQDTQALLSWLAAQKSFGRLAVIGHSEGSLIGLAALQQPPVEVSAFVSLEGAGENIADTLSRQLHANPANPPALVQEADQIIDQLKAGKAVPTVSPLLQSIFRPSVQPYLISEFKYTPTALIATLKLPILIVQGGHDIQVSVADAQKLKAANPAAQLLLVPTMNHVLVDSATDMNATLAAYANASLPLDPAVLRGVSDFLKANLK